MKERPFFAFAATGCLFATVLSSPSLNYVGSSCFLTLTAATCITLGIPRVRQYVRLFGSLAFGAWVVSQGAQTFERSYNTLGANGRARIQATVESISKTKNYVLLDGEVDMVVAPATNCRVWVRVPRGLRFSLEVGQEVIAVSNLRLPTNSISANSFSEAAWLKSSGAMLIGEALDISLVKKSPVIARVLSHTVRYCQTCLSEYVSTSTAQVLFALILGNEQGISPERKTAYSLSGTAHVLAVSGTHVILLATILAALLGGRIRRWWQVCLIVTILTFFVLLTGAEPPAVRALAMSACVFVGMLGQRMIDSLNVLGFVVIGQLIVDPNTFNNAGFLLSVTATAAIILLVQPLHSMLCRCFSPKQQWQQWLTSSSALTLAASAGIAIPSALLFGQYALWSPVANLFVVPLMSGAMVAGLVIIGLGWISSAVAIGAAWTASASINAAEWFVYNAANSTPNISLEAASVLALLHVFAVLWILRSTSSKSLAARIVLVIICALLLIPHVPTPPTGIFIQQQRARALYVVAQTNQRTLEFTVEIKHGIPFVRSWHDNMGNRK